MDGRLATRIGDSVRRDRSVWLGAAIAWAAAGVLLSPPVVERSVRRTRPAPSAAPPAPTAPPPALPSAELLPLTPEDARAINAAVPFVDGAPPPARPFRARMGAVDREAALTCLAAAGWYEAGDDPDGARAVAQVVLNRVRHAAFPKTVCGVVLQGAERRTGCQFTFTCDGALARRPSPEAWARARMVAGRALDGAVDARVGLATHYHTDWVVPYWSRTLDKVARVGTHLFFRWTGWWGTGGAFRASYAGGERLDPRLPGAPALIAAAPPGLELPLPDVPVSEAVTVGGAVPAPTVPGLAPGEVRGAAVRVADLRTNSFALKLRPGAFPGDWAVGSVAICRGRPDCTVLGYLEEARVPSSLPVPREQWLRASFLFRRGADASSGRALWHCGQIAGVEPAQCFPGTEHMAQEAGGGTPPSETAAPPPSRTR